MDKQKYSYEIKLKNTKTSIYLTVKIKSKDNKDIRWSNLQNSLHEYIHQPNTMEQEFFFQDRIIEKIGLLDENNQEIIDHILKYAKCFEEKFILHDQYVRDLLNLLIDYPGVYSLDTKEKLKVKDNYQRIKLKIKGNQNYIKIKPQEDKPSQLYKFKGENWYRYGNTIGKLISAYSKNIWEEILTKGKTFSEKELFNFANHYKSYWQRYIDFKWSENLRRIRILDNNLKIKLLLDYKEGEIKVRPLYYYGEFKFHYEDIIKKGSYIVQYENKNLFFIKREPKKERRLFLFFFKYNFKWEKDSFVLKNDKKIINFLTEGFDKIPTEWNKKLTINFRKIRIFDITVRPVFNIDLQKDKSNFSINLKTRLEEEHEIDPEKIKENVLNEKKYIKVTNFKIYKIKNLDEVKDAFDSLTDTFNFDFQDEKIYANNIYFLPHLTQHLNKYENIELEGDNEFREMYKEMMNVKGVKKVPIPKDLDERLRDYQKKGYYWLRFLHRYKLSGILADDMGLGKTVQAITLIKSIDTTVPSLVVCPKSLMHNWYKEFQKFTPEMNVLIIEGNRSRRRELIKKYYNKNYDVFITSYSLLRNDIDHYQDKNYYFTILDEAQHIKNYKTKRAKSVKKLNSNFRYVLTGTPMENSLMELWSIFDFIMPGYLGTYRQFSNYYNKAITQENDEEVLKELNMKIKPFVLRRTKDEVLKELPPKIVQVSSIPLNQKQDRLYNNVLSEMKKKIFGMIEQNGYNKSRMHILSALTKLRQLCNHPGMIYPELKDKFFLSSKMELLHEILQESIEGEHRILLFSQFVKMLHIIRNYLRKRNINYEYMDGKSTKRLDIVENFNNNEDIPIFLVSLKAGGTGLNITGADTVIHFDPWWNPMVEQQATDRAHRIGQTKVVNVYKFITEDTVEEKIMKLQEEKKDLFHSLDFTDQSFLKTMDWDDLKILFE